MEFSRDDLNEAKRQIDSTLHKLRETIINVDERDQALNAFLKKLKFSVFVKQYEMRKHFFA